MSCLRLIPIALFASGCQQLFGLDDSKPRGDHTCYGTAIEVCFDEPPPQELTLDTPIDTGTIAGVGASPACMTYTGSDAGLYCVIAADALGIPTGAVVSVSGSRPLVLIATDAMDIQGTLDAAAHIASQRRGPAADVAPCAACLAAPGPQGGGTGGTFGGTGAFGGSTAGGSLGGGVCPAPDSITFRAGCGGQNGGGADASTGLGGGGGGAVYLIAGSAININGTGTVDVSGAGGNGGRCTVCDGTNGDAYGGGGGGSGGMLIFESQVIHVIGRVFADGGGGGEGASHAAHGKDGADPDGTAAAPGGLTDSTFHGGAGGAGDHLELGAIAGGQGTASPSGGGGGGGGGGGVIEVHGTLSGTVSPPPITF